MEASVNSQAVRPKSRPSLLRAPIRIAILAVCAVFAAWILYPDQDSLLHLARPIGNLVLPAKDYYSTYVWMPDNTIRFLSWTLPSGGPEVLSYDGESGKQLWSRPVLSTDLRGMSPDGKWLLYDLGEHYGSGMRKAVSLDGAPSRLWPGLRFNGVWGMEWKANGSEWVECGRDRLVIYSLANTMRRVIDLPKSAGAVPAWYDSGGTLVSHNIDTGGWYVKSTTWFVTSLRNPPSVRQIDFPIPPGAVLQKAALSPSEDWVLWSFDFEESRPMWLVRFLSFFSRVQSNTQRFASQSVYVSHPDGSGMREIGRIRLREKPGGAASVGWDRTGSNICFIYDHGLFLIPFTK
jgi:hypothetical protein